MSIADIGPTLRKLRITKGLKIREAAELVGCSAPSIHHWENGNSSPRWRDVCRMAEIFGVSINEIAMDAARRKW